MEIPRETAAVIQRFAQAEGPALTALVKLAVVAMAVQMGVSQREIMDRMFTILPEAETEAEARVEVVESCTLIARDPTLADDVLALAERWNAIVQAS